MRDNHCFLSSSCVSTTQPVLSCYHDVTDWRTEAQGVYTWQRQDQTRVCLMDSKPELPPWDKGTQLRTHFAQHVLFVTHSQTPTKTLQSLEASAEHFQSPIDIIPLFFQDTNRNSYIFQQRMFVERREELGNQMMGMIPLPPASEGICQLREEPCSFFLQWFSPGSYIKHQTPKFHRMASVVCLNTSILPFSHQDLPSICGFLLPLTFIIFVLTTQDIGWLKERPLIQRDSHYTSHLDARLVLAGRLV